MIPSAAMLLAAALVFAAGLWLAARPWQARHWRRDAETAHETRRSLYEAHMGEVPPWADTVDYPPEPRAVRLARLYRLAGALLMAIGAALLYNRFARLGVI
ncbi:MAG: hypothetical protein LC648_04390 [Novosphingobium sp.]|nr:hypothetical protein [Novosphingobium sp.]